MKVLLLGSGGREHALALKISGDPLCSHLFVAPGNPGIAQCGTCVNIGVNDFEAIKSFAIENGIEMVVVGPEDPLVNGIFDFFANDPALQHIPVIGPSKEGAQLEGSKAFAKQFMMRHRVPTASYKEFSADNYEEGIAYLAQHSLPIVLKADGLAAGKGVVIAESREHAQEEFAQMIKDAKFGDASKKVVVEQFLSGIELSVFVLTDGQSYKILPTAKDYKRIGLGDTGLNTGGMGAISPVPFADAEFMKKVEDRVIRPTVEGLHKEQINYKGFIFIGLIKVEGEPYVIEYNCRMGDPETEVVMPRLKNNLLSLLKAVADGTLAQEEIQEDERAAATVVIVSGGYPGDYEKGKVITNIPGNNPAQIIFHAGTKSDGQNILTNGGRVIAVTSLASDLQEALRLSKQIAASITFEGKYFREDIGFEFVPTKS